jgi:hypothetical protein
MEITKNNLADVLMKELKSLRTTQDSPTLWDAFVSLVGDQVPVHILILKADMMILRYVAEGRAVRAIHQMTGIPSKAVRKIAFTWGMTPVKEDLDFNALLVYNSGMTVEMFEFKMNEVLPLPLNSSVYKRLIGNIERYLDLQQILEDEDGDDKND